MSARTMGRRWSSTYVEITSEDETDDLVCGPLSAMLHFRRMIGNAGAERFVQLTCAFLQMPLCCARAGSRRWLNVVGQDG